MQLFFVLLNKCTSRLLTGQGIPESRRKLGNIRENLTDSGKFRYTEVEVNLIIMLKNEQS